MRHIYGLKFLTSRAQHNWMTCRENMIPFKEELGTVKKFQASLHLKDQAQLKFFRPRPVPFAIRDAVARELDRLEKEKNIEKITHSEWEAPIVAVPKKNGRLRICGDYKVTINPVLEVDKHPLPRPEELFATLSGGKKFPHLDLSQAYTQIVLDDISSGYVTIKRVAFSCSKT